MIRAALAAVALSGCSVITRVQVLPTFDPKIGIGCCVAHAELSRSTSASLEVLKNPTAWTVTATLHTQF